jgi:hypothetical protein
MCSTYAGRNGATWASTCALDLFGLGSSVSDGETTPGEPTCKRPWKFPLPKHVPKPFVTKGNFERLLSLFYCFENCDSEPFFLI